MLILLLLLVGVRMVGEAVTIGEALCGVGDEEGLPVVVALGWWLSSVR